MSPRLAFLSFLLVARPEAQTSAPLLAPRDLLVPIHGHQGGDDGDYGVWAGAATFKASFHDGFVFYPLLGARHPRNLPWRWQTVAVTAGSASIELAAKPARASTAWRYEYLHPGLCERYDVSEAGVEQSFVITRSLATTHDLVIRGRVTTELRADATASRHQAIEFRDDDARPHVRYGAAVACDAGGDRIAVATAFDGSDVTLTVDGAWLAGARFPVVVDPLTSALVLETSAVGEVASTDVGYESQSLLSTMFAVDRAFSASDHDVFAFIVPDSLQTPTMVFSDVSNNHDDRNVTVAAVSDAMTWMIGFQRGYSLNGNPSSTIRVHFHDVGNTNLNSGMGVSIPQSTVAFLRNPDLGGTPAVNGTTGMLVYTSDPTSANGVNTAVMAAPIAGLGWQIGTAYQVGAVNVGTAYDREAPSINQVSGGGWMIVWQELSRQLPNDAWDIVGSRIGAAGQKVASAPIADGGNTVHHVQPQVAGYGDDFLVTFAATADLSSLTGVDLRARKVTWPTTAASPTTFAVRTIASAVPPVTALGNSGLAFNVDALSTAVAVYTGTAGSTRSAFATRLGGTGVPIDTHTVFSTPGLTANAPSVTFSESLRGFPIVYGTDESPGSNFLYGRRYDYPSAANTALYGTACGTAVLSGAFPYLGNDRYRIQVGSAPSNTALILLVSPAMGSAALDGIGMTGCVLNLDPARIVFFLSGVTSASGLGAIAFPIPDLIPPVPLDAWFQVLYVNLGANPAGVQATRGLHAQFR